MEMKKRPESPHLDDSQMEELNAFFSSMNEGELRQALEQTIRDAESDPGVYTHGGVPANLSRAYLAIQNSLERFAKKKGK